LGFTLEDRRENIRRVAEVNRLFLEAGFFTVNAFITPTEEFRTMARSIIGADRFFQIYLNTPVSICIKRDPKGLYKKAMAGAINEFTGVNSPFEECKSANLIIDTSVHSVQSCIQTIMRSLQIVA
jgi:adenylylsulfate kinase